MKNIGNMKLAFLNMRCKKNEFDIVWKFVKADFGKFFISVFIDVIIF